MKLSSFLIEKQVVENIKEFQELISIRAIKINDKIIDSDFVVEDDKINDKIKIEVGKLVLFYI